MPQTNYTPIQLYRTATASAAPVAGNLLYGELAINYNDGKLFYKDSGGVVRVLASQGASSVGGSNTQIQYNSSGTFAGSVNLTFDGTNLLVGGNATAAALIPSGSSLPTNGIYLPSANTLGFSSNSNARGSVSSTGSWSLATPSSGQALTITAATGGATNGGITLNGSGATPPVTVTFSATAMTLDCTRSNVFRTTFTANVTTAPTIDNPQNGQTINWLITQDSTGGWTMTWPTSFKWPGGTAGVLSTTANSIDLLIAMYDSSTGYWYANLQKGFA